MGRQLNICSLLTGCFFAIVALGAGTLLADEPVLPVWLVRNWEDPNSDAPGNFRTLQDSPHRDEETALLPTRIGMLFLRASGSAQFSEKNLQWIKHKLGKYKITVVDLRQEAHGFLNGLPISWYMAEDQINRGKGLAQIESDEESRLDGLLRKKDVTVFKLADSDEPQGFERGVDPELVKVNDAVTEKQLCADLELYYVRLPVADYQRPADKEVDRFIELVRSMDQDSWLHIHCAQGVGRTTIFLAMFDMMHNAKYVSLEDIVKRQWLLGGIDLLSTDVSNQWEYPYAEERANFVRHFYQYCQNNNDDFKQLWSEWLKQMENR
jgi:hypothetical protein